jgi:hypothetical protein
VKLDESLLGSPQRQKAQLESCAFVFERTVF